MTSAPLVARMLRDSMGDADDEAVLAELRGQPDGAAILEVQRADPT